MGRPIKKKSIGNNAASGNQIAATAYIPGDNQVRDDAYIVSQKGTGKYIMASPTTTAQGLVQLVDGNVTSPGQANVVVTPWGAHGSGATVTANVGVGSFQFSFHGGGGAGKNYKPGDVLNLVGGTYNKVANITIQSVNLVAPVINSKGTGYTANSSYLLFEGSDWSSTGNLKVTATDVNGNITAVSTISGVFVGTSLPGSPTAPTTTIGGGAGATITFQWDAGTAVVNSAGDYSVIPANPVGLTTSPSGGIQANVNVTWAVTSLHITAAGSGYDAANLVFESGAATATPNFTAGALTSTTVLTGGSYTGRPNVTVQHATSPVYAAVIYDNTVKDFDGVEYAYNLDQTTLTGPGQATIQSS